MIIFKLKNLLWLFLKKLANLSFSIFVLFLIAIFSLIGSVIEQDQTLSYYQTYYPDFGSKSFFINWKVIDYFGFNHLYQTWWFIAILILFVLSLVSCTLSTQLPSFKNARRWKFISNKPFLYSYYPILSQNNLVINSFSNMIYSLVKCNFFVFHQSNSIYAYKGLYGRIAPIVVHISIIITLLGSFIGFFFGFISQEIIPNGEVFHIKNILKSGSYSYLPIEVTGRIKDFYTEYNFDNSAKQFFSELSIFYRSKMQNYPKLISVNSPLVFKGVTFYQTDWKMNSLRIQLGNNVIQKKLVKTTINQKDCWLCSISLDGVKEVFFVLFSLNNSVTICDSTGFIVGVVNVRESFYINNIYCIIKDVMTSTGLQIKVDPGIFLVYLGFFLIMVSTVLSYLSYSQIWVYGNSIFFEFLGSTNRSVLFFESDSVNINRLYKFYTLRYKLSEASNLFIYKVLVI
uniref:Cytochrome c biogenesis protein Ccs1 n=1 Tax=Cliftonaea pectinata TaxID=2007206 RepID=A0A1Z1MQ71_9FLOR|nr:cytochrome c biogenesis protein ccs1 [Cliftonaea pectinata]ARW68009.1 cytochrome c biogenesis protein ccs1 [Cliftonaea pectinata]